MTISQYESIIYTYNNNIGTENKMSNEDRFEKRFINILNQVTDRDKAIDIAIEVILDLLEQAQTQARISPAHLPELSGITAS